MFVGASATLLEVIQVYPVPLESLTVIRIFNRVVGITSTSVRFRYPRAITLLRVTVDNLDKLVPPAVRPHFLCRN